SCGWSRRSSPLGSSIDWLTSFGHGSTLRTRPGTALSLPRQVPVLLRHHLASFQQTLERQELVLDIPAHHPTRDRNLELWNLPLDPIALGQPSRLARAFHVMALRKA